ncbi:AAA family ATPase [Chitinophagales bacterium]|nr:AAA family ATPase [Chitinophagales bacterium]
MILSSLRLRNFPESKKDLFPFTLPLVQNLEEIEFEKNISFFVGENGSGKSTILEAIAAYTEVPLAGSFRLEDDESLAAANELANYLSLSYKEKTRHGFFVRAEDFIGYARSLKNEIKALDKEIEEVKESFTGGDIKLAIGPIEGEKNSLIKRYSADMEAMSHGEGFLKFFTSRITARGLYLIDEPEAALSPTRQLSLLSLIIEKVKKTGAHFIIATHSPIIMSVPNSEVFYFQEGTITKMDYKETEHYQLTKSILENPDGVMGILGSE